MIMTRVWPIAMMQLPTAIYMVSEFMNSLRVVYLDGRPHSDPDVVVRSFNGESIGRWEGDTLVVDTKYFVGAPPLDRLRHSRQRRAAHRRADAPAEQRRQTLEIEYTMTDPKGWEGEMKLTKRWNRVDDQDIAEVSCLPDLNDHIPSTQSERTIVRGPVLSDRPEITS